MVQKGVPYQRISIPDKILALWQLGEGVKKRFLREVRSRKTEGKLEGRDSIRLKKLEPVVKCLAGTYAHRKKGDLNYWGSKKSGEREEKVSPRNAFLERRKLPFSDATTL